MKNQCTRKGQCTGAVSATPWAFWDVLPTMLEIAGVPMPSGAELDGRSIVPALRGSAQSAADYMYWTWRGNVHSGGVETAYSDPGDGKAQPGYAVRVGDWKGVVHACVDTIKNAPSAADEMELYDLIADPYETTNVAAAHASVVTVIKTKLAGQGLSCTCFQC